MQKQIQVEIVVQGGYEPACDYKKRLEKRTNKILLKTKKMIGVPVLSVSASSNGRMTTIINWFIKKKK